MPTVLAATVRMHNQAGEKSHAIRLGATGSGCAEFVVALNLRVVLARMQCSAMSFLTRSLPTRTPLANNCFQIRGQPYSPLTWAWVALM